MYVCMCTLYVLILRICTFAQPLTFKREKVIPESSLSIGIAIDHFFCISNTLMDLMDPNEIYVLSNVPSQYLPSKMYIHNGCICSTFLHCVFSNVSSNGLPKRMHNHIVYICSAFLHCAISYVSSKRLHNKMQTHTGCICLACLHCV